MTFLLQKTTYTRLMLAKMPSDKKWVDVPDAKLSQDQQDLLKTAKSAFNIPSENYTFSVGNLDDGGRTVIEPKLVNFAGVTGVRWGKESYGLNGHEIEEFKVIGSEIRALVAGVWFNVGLAKINPADKPTKIQKALLLADTKEKKVDILNKMAKANLPHILSKPGAGFKKLKELSKGSYTVVSYDLVMTPFGYKYEMLLADGVKVQANMSLGDTLGYWDDECVEVSKDRPAELVIEGSFEGKQGVVVRASIYSSADKDLEAFDLSDLGGLVEEPIEETEDLEPIDLAESIHF